MDKEIRNIVNRFMDNDLLSKEDQKRNIIFYVKDLFQCESTVLKECDEEKPELSKLPEEVEEVGVFYKQSYPNRIAINEIIRYLKSQEKS